MAEHAAYVDALQAAGVQVTVLEALEQFPDSMFVEDPPWCSARRLCSCGPELPAAWRRVRS